jgi:hypothetical protein
MTQTYIMPVYFVRKWFHGYKNIINQSLAFVRLKAQRIKPITQEIKAEPFVQMIFVSIC